MSLLTVPWCGYSWKYHNGCWWNWTLAGDGRCRRHSEGLGHLDLLYNWEWSSCSVSSTWVTLMACLLRMIAYTYRNMIWESEEWCSNSQTVLLVILSIIKFFQWLQVNEHIECKLLSLTDIVYTTSTCIFDVCLFNSHHSLIVCCSATCISLSTHRSQFC